MNLKPLLDKIKYGAELVKVRIDQITSEYDHITDQWSVVLQTDDVYTAHDLLFVENLDKLSEEQVKEIAYGVVIAHLVCTNGMPIVRVQWDMHRYTKSEVRPR